MAEMMLDGTCSPVPRRSNTRAARRAARHDRERQIAAGKNFPCRKCGKAFRNQHAVYQHARDVHTAADLSD